MRVTYARLGNLPSWHPLARQLLLVVLCLAPAVGCYAPLHSYGIHARDLPDSFRTPTRTAGEPLNLASLAIPFQEDYILGPNDLLEVTVYDLKPGKETRPLRVPVMASGNVHLPMVGAVHVARMNLLQAQEAITKVYVEKEIQPDPLVTVTMAEKSMTTIGVYGEVKSPGQYKLPKGETDVAHALAAAQGLSPDAASVIEVHRGRSAHRADASGQREQGRIERTRTEPSKSSQIASSQEMDAAVLILAEGDNGEPPATCKLEGDVFDPSRASDAGERGGIDQVGLHVLGRPLVAQRCYPAAGAPAMDYSLKEDSNGVLRIPLRGLAPDALRPEDVTLNPGDAIVVPSRTAEVFYVVGTLNPLNFVRLSQGRELGGGFLLPKDREIDVVTAVAMAGGTDPINSPTRVVLQREGPGGDPMLIKVDLIKARYDRRESVLVQAGDILYLDPNAAWWTRRTFDRVIDNLFIQVYRVQSRP